MTRRRGATHVAPSGRGFPRRQAAHRRHRRRFRRTFGGASARPRARRGHAHRPPQLPPLPASPLSGRDRRPLPADIATPIRAILRRQRNATILLARVSGIDPAARIIETETRRIPYDVLVVATGARHAYFGHDEWESVAPGLKTIDDATGIRRRILLAFERAEQVADAAERRRLLTFLIIGAGPTGVELAGALAELGRKALAADFRNIDPRDTRVVLVEAGPRILAAFPESLSAAAKRALEGLGVEVLLGQPVTRCDADGVELGERRIEA